MYVSLEPLKFLSGSWIIHLEKRVHMHVSFRSPSPFTFLWDFHSSLFKEKLVLEIEFCRKNPHIVRMCYLKPYFYSVLSNDSTKDLRKQFIKFEAAIRRSAIRNPCL